MTRPDLPVSSAARARPAARAASGWLVAMAIAAGISPAVASEPPAKPVAQTTPSTGEPAVDRLQLDATSITGNRELPKVMSIVPWKAAEPPAGPDRPMGSLIEELLAPLDRDEFRREIAYHRDLTSRTTPVAPNVAVPGVSQP